MEAFIIIIVALVAVGVVASVAGKGPNTAVWREAARRLGLQCKAGELLTDPEIFGTLHGCRVHVEGRREDGVIGSVHYRVSHPNPVGFNLKITRRRAHGGESGFMGAPPIETGDAEFDSAVLVKGRDPDRIRTLLTEPNRRRIARLLTVQPGALIDDSHITWRQQEVPQKPGEIVTAVDRMVALARHLSGYHIQQLDHPPEAPSVETPRVTDVRHGPASAGYDAVVPDTAPGEARADERPGATEVTAAAAEPSEPADRAAHPGPTIDEVCRALFGQTLSSADAINLFERLFRNREVTWSGTLASLATYPFDRVFGSERGAKATVTICEAHERFGARAIHAVIQLPPDDVADLRTLVGGKVDFRGTLLQCDHFMRSLFVNNGRIRAAADDQT